jgi:ABC-type transport system involved in cytochrome c biogenesis permease subunit
MPEAGAAEGLVAWGVATHRMVSLGFPLLTLGLVLGAVWGKRAWGDYWNWDPKELWSLVSWLVYVAYFHVRYVLGPRHSRLAAALVVAGCVAVVITLLVVNLSRVFGGMHSYAS